VPLQLHERELERAAMIAPLREFQHPEIAPEPAAALDAPFPEAQVVLADLGRVKGDRAAAGILMLHEPGQEPAVGPPRPDQAGQLDRDVQTVLAAELGDLQQLRRLRILVRSHHAFLAILRKPRQNKRNWPGSSEGVR
jgi:hypothetical protein